MRRRLINILALGVKELYSIRADPVMLVLIIYTFSYAVYAVATGAKLEVNNASVAIVDEDHSEVSQRSRRTALLGKSRLQRPCRLEQGRARPPA